MPRTRINCPNCRQPITADIDQLFDVNVDPTAKQKIMSGAFNVVQCPNCGYTGSLATPVVYHDPEKELLLTFVPPEVNLPKPEQERLIGSLIQQVISNLPQEKRKGYLFSPQSTLTLQGLVERVLEGEGITREMIQAQQQKLNLIQRLIQASDDVLAEVVKTEDKNMDAEFFALLRRLVEASLMGGDRDSAEALAGLQERLIPLTSYGREMQAQSQEIEAAMNDLRAAGRDLTRDKLLDMIIQAPSDTRMRALVSLARPVMDYAFFQLLSERIEQAQGDERFRLSGLREELLSLTQEIDRQVEERGRQSHQLLEAILASGDIRAATMQALGAVDDFFINDLRQMQDTARQKGDLDQLGKLGQVMEVIQQASAPPPEISLIEEMLEAETDADQRRLLEEHADEITPEFLSTLSSLAGQVENSQDAELASRLKALNRQALRFSMEKNLR